MIIVGENEMNSTKVSVRKKREGDIGKMSLTELENILNLEVLNHTK